MGLIITGALIAALVAFPGAALNVLWNMVIPLLPAVFLLNPVIWRNVCPLASINAMSARARSSRRMLEAPLSRITWLSGAVLLAAMVPARRFLFNENAVAMVVTILLVAALAVAGGFLFARRGGFCNSVCPVLPVEKLYGQAPLMPVGTARCHECSACTPVGCIELASLKTVRQTVGPARRDAHWLVTSFGIFAAAFPGFIIGYFTTTDGALDTAQMVYARILTMAVASYLVVAVVTLSLRVDAIKAIAALGVLSFSLYYWHAAIGLGKAYGAPVVGVIVVRIVALALVLVWIATYRRRILPEAHARHAA